MPGASKGFVPGVRAPEHAARAPSAPRRPPRVPRRAPPALARARAQALALDEALNITSAARLVTTGEAPYTIIHTNKAWHDITGWKFTEVAGQTCRLLQGPATGGPALEALHKGLRTRTPVKTELGKVKKYMEKIKKVKDAETEEATEGKIVKSQGRQLQIVTNAKLPYLSSKF